MAGFLGDFAAAFARSEEARAVAEEVGDQAALARALGGQGSLRVLRDPAGARQALERVYRLAHASGAQWDMMYAKLNLAFSHVFCGQWDEGETALEAALPLLEQMNSYEGRAWYWLAKSMKHFWAADAGPFRDDAEQAVNAAREVGEPATQASAHSLMARIEIAQGDPAAAVERLEACRARTIVAGAGWALPRIDIGLAHARAELGELAAARSMLEPIVASGADFGYTLDLATAQLTDILRIAGDVNAVEGRARETLAIGERIEVGVFVGLANEQLGRVALARDEPGQAEELLHRALAAHLDYGAVRCLPQTFDALAETAVRLDSGKEAVRILGAAHRLREELGLARSRHDEPRIAALEQTLREQLGDAVFGDAFEQGTALSPGEAVTWMRHARGERKRPSRGWESLTPTELRVVDLVADGLTNPQIGERMFISRGTVKVHLSHIFAKLNMASRAELAAEAARRELGANP